MFAQGYEQLLELEEQIPDGLPEDCPDADFTCAGLAYFPSRDAFTEILADPDINYNASSSSYTRWYYPD